MARVVFDSFEPNNACFESPVAKAPAKKTDECEVKAVFHAEGTPGYDPSMPPTVYFKRRGTNEFYLVNSPTTSVSVGLLKGLGFQENDSVIQSKIYYSIGLTNDLITLYESFLAKKQRPVKPFPDLVLKYKDFLITGSPESPDPITKSKTASLLENILNASDDALEFIDKLNQSFKDPNGNQSRLLPDMAPKIEWLASLIRLHIELAGYVPPLQGSSPELFSQTERWIKKMIIYLGTGSGDPQVIFDELKKLCDTYREQGNIPSEHKNLAEILKKSLAPFHDIGTVSKLPNVQYRWNQVIHQLMQEEMRFYLQRAAQLGTLQTEVVIELKQAKLSKYWFENKERMDEVTEAVLSGIKAFHGNSKELLFKLDPSSIESAVKKMVAKHGIQEREYIIATLAALRFIKSQGWLGIINNETKVDPKVKFRITADASKALEAYEQKLIRKLSTSLTKTNIVLPIVEAGICLIGGVLAGSGGGIQNRNLTLTGSTITGFGCSALAVHFIPNRNPYLTDSLTALLGGGLGFTAAWFATQNMNNGMPPDMMMPPPIMPDPNGRNPVSEWGP